MIKILLVYDARFACGCVKSETIKFANAQALASFMNGVTKEERKDGVLCFYTDCSACKNQLRLFEQRQEYQEKLDQTHKSGGA